MKSTFRVLFYLKKNAKTASKEVMIMARITIDGKVCQFSTKQKISPNGWNVSANKAIGRSFEAMKLNSLLEEIKASLHKIYQSIQLKG